MALKRRPQAVQVESGHFKYLWAAYRRSCFAAFPDYTEGLSRDDFVQRLSDGIRDLIWHGGEAYIMIAPTPYGVIPVGLAVVEQAMPPGCRRQAQPQAIWFPEASPRNKLEAGLELVLKLKKDALVLIWAREATWTYLAHLCDFGALRPTGKIRGFWQDGSDAMLYQSRAKE